MEAVPLWAEWLFAAAVAGLLAVVAVWGVAVQRLTRRIETAHPDWAEALRGRSRKKAARLALSSEVQRALFAGEAPPPAVLADPVCARWLRAEASARKAFVPLALVGFGVFALA